MKVLRLFSWTRLLYEDDGYDRGMLEEEDFGKKGVFTRYAIRFIIEVLHIYIALGWGLGVECSPIRPGDSSPLPPPAYLVFMTRPIKK